MGLRDWNEMRKWRRRGFLPPSPRFIRQVVLSRNGVPGSTWIETGTYKGQTTRFLAGLSTRVYTIEPEPALFEAAAKSLSSLGHVEALKGTSEEVLPGLLPRVEGDVSFWLDGHYSAGNTFQGASDTPIIEELATIRNHLDRLGRISIMVDDVRCFISKAPEYAGYPPLTTLIEWSETNGFDWHIEHDIFVARRT